jgi:hypothetical protein
VFDQLFPQRIDHSYNGRKLALWLFAVVVTVRMVQSVLVIFNGHFVLMSADGMPLDTYTPASARTVVSIWALAGLYRLIICLLCLLVLARYRAAIPFMFALLTFEFLARQLILYFLPLERTGTPPGPLVNLVLFVLTVVGLALSLSNRKAPGD